jgi:hypothetical protein
MKNQQRIAMYVGLGVLLAVAFLYFSGRLSERYEEASEAELLNFLEEVESSPSTGDEGSMGPAPMGEDSDSEDEDED